jgi:hypothetical protein
VAAKESLMFKIGVSYTPREISRAVGGDLQSYLPHVGGTVVAARLRLALNPDAPDIILPGTGPMIQQSAEWLVNQGSPVPTFIKRAPGQFEFVGEYGAARMSRDPAEIAVHARRTGRRDITSVIHMAR